MKVRALFVAASLVVVSACGGATAEAPPPETTTHRHDEERDRRPPPVDDGMSVEGLIGHLSQQEISRGLDGKQERFLQCFASRLDDVDVLSGEVNLTFHIAVDGQVAWVFMNASSLGDREAEQCIVGVAASARFPRPHGGEAEFTYPLAFDLPDDTRPAVNWTPQRIARQLEEGVGIAERCRPAGSAAVYTATMYVARRSVIVSVGVSSSTYDGVPGLECVAEALHAWVMPNPGSYPAKVTFEVP